jgi:hypothetical protein
MAFWISDGGLCILYFGKLKICIFDDDDKSRLLSQLGLKPMTRPTNTTFKLAFQDVLRPLSTHRQVLSSLVIHLTTF